MDSTLFKDEIDVDNGYGMHHLPKLLYRSSETKTTINFSSKVELSEFNKLAKQLRLSARLLLCDISI